MKKVGDIVTWNSKTGKVTGEIMKVMVKYEYYVLVEPERKQYVKLTEQMAEP